MTALGRERTNHFAVVSILWIRQRSATHTCGSEHSGTYRIGRTKPRGTPPSLLTDQRDPRTHVGSGSLPLFRW